MRHLASPAPQQGFGSSVKGHEWVDRLDARFARARPIDDARPRRSVAQDPTDLAGDTAALRAALDLRAAVLTAAPGICDKLSSWEVLCERRVWAAHKQAAFRDNAAMYNRVQCKIGQGNVRGMGWGGCTWFCSIIVIRV